MSYESQQASDIPGLHKIEDDLSETWLENYAAEGIAAMEKSLAKHLAFLIFLDSQGSEQAINTAGEDQVS